MQLMCCQSPLWFRPRPRSPALTWPVQWNSWVYETCCRCGWIQNQLLWARSLEVGQQRRCTKDNWENSRYRFQTTQAWFYIVHHTFWLLCMIIDIVWADGDSWSCSHTYNERQLGVKRGCAVPNLFCFANLLQTNGHVHKQICKSPTVQMLPKQWCILIPNFQRQVMLMNLAR